MLCLSTQSEGGLCTASDAAGATELPLRLEYGDFGESHRLLVPLSPRLLATLSPCLHLNICLSGEADPVVQEKSNASNYNIKIFLSVGNKEIQDIGVLYDEGRKCVLKGLKSYRKLRTNENFLKDMQGYRV